LVIKLHSFIFKLQYRHQTDKIKIKELVQCAAWPLKTMKSVP